MKTSPAQLLLPNKVLVKPSIKQLIVSVLTKVWQHLTDSFVGSNELRIWQTYDQFGNPWWHAYDPITGRHTLVQSEAELRAWIEQVYYK